MEKLFCHPDKKNLHAQTLTTFLFSSTPSQRPISETCIASVIEVAASKSSLFHFFVTYWLQNTVLFQYCYLLVFLGISGYQ